ncbi:hypothetical protein HDU81_003365 [Chytriomyces hyalinus]|nr:hypothetical protein HDU81_003365 [Chytriomyces hyalinus]
MQTRSQARLLVTKPAAPLILRQVLKPKPKSSIRLADHITPPKQEPSETGITPSIATVSLARNASNLSDGGQNPSKKRRSSPVKPKLESKRNPPANWELVYDEIKIFRQTNPAPVDTIGCGILASPTLPPNIFRFQTFIALLLSSQTKDPINAAAIERLITQLPGGLTPESVLKVDLETLQSILRGVSFHLRKGVYMKGASQILVDKFDSDVPKDLEEILGLPGIGPKMAHLAMQCCWGVNDSGIGVDTHVHRIANKLGWANTRKEDPEATRKELEEWLPSKYWAEINPLLVGFGQVHCTAVRPSCDTCPVSNMCPRKGFKKGK